jgi:hypothetical protein
VGPTFLHAGSVWHLQSSRQWEEIRCRRRRLLMSGYQHLDPASPYRVRTAPNIFFGNEGVKYTVYTLPRLTNCYVAVKADLAAWCQVSAPNGTRSTHLSFLSYSPSSVTIALPEWPDHRGDSIRKRRVLKTLFQGCRYCTAAQRVVFERRYVCFIESSLAWWQASFGPLGSLDRVCPVSLYAFL